MEKRKHGKKNQNLPGAPKGVLVAEDGAPKIDVVGAAGAGAVQFMCK